MGVPSQRETLLIVDDEDVVTRLLRLKLQKEVYQCEETNNARELC